MKKTLWIIAIICGFLAMLVAGFGAGMLAMNGKAQNESVNGYENQDSVTIKDGEKFISESYDFEATSAPEASVYDPAAVDEAMGEEGIDRPKTSGEEQYDWLIEEYGPPIYDGWICNGPAYICRGEEAEEEREDEYSKWADENGIPEDLEDEARAEAEAPWTCEGSGSYGDYSPEGYEGCPGR